MAVTERGGRRLGEELGCTVPGKVRRSTARGTRASHATLGNSEYVGEQDWDIKSNAWFAASR